MSGKSKAKMGTLVTVDRDLIKRKLGAAKRDHDIVLKLGAGVVLGIVIHKLLS